MGQGESLEAFLEGAPLVDEQELLSRRKFLTGALVGGAAGLAVAAGTGAAVWKASDAELQAAREAAAAELSATKEAAATELESANKSANVELARVLGLLDLYEELEKVGLDAIVETAMAALALPMKAVEAGARALKSGLDWAEGAMASLAEALPTAQESLLWLEDRVSAVAWGIERVETAVIQALNRVGNNPIGAAVKEFSNELLDLLPLGLGDRFRGVLDGLVELATRVDELVEGINSSVLEPLRERWFSDEDGKGLGGTLMRPMVEQILDPLEAHLADLSTLADAWQDKLVSPSHKALAERARLREEIARYKQENGLV